MSAGGWTGTLFFFLKSMQMRDLHTAKRSGPGLQPERFPRVRTLVNSASSPECQATHRGLQPPRRPALLASPVSEESEKRPQRHPHPAPKKL